MTVREEARWVLFNLLDCETGAGINSVRQYSSQEGASQAAHRKSDDRGIATDG